MNGQDALWSSAEVRTQAAQCRDQLTVWDCIAEPDWHSKPCAPGWCDCTERIGK